MIFLKVVLLLSYRIGSGLRMKILDAVSLGIPFVTTSKGVEGISFNDNEECLKADTAMDFADAILGWLMIVTCSVDLFYKLNVN